MRGYFKANEIRSMALDKTDVLELVTRDDFVGLTIIHEDGSAGVLSLAQDRFDIFPASETLVTALACRDLLLVEAVTAPVPISNMERNPFGWLLVCPEGLAVVCRGKDPLGFEVVRPVSLTSGKELGLGLMGNEAKSAIQRWRLHRMSAKEGDTTTVYDNAP